MSHSKRKLKSSSSFYSSQGTFFNNEQPLVITQQRVRPAFLLCIVVQMLIFAVFLVWHIHYNKWLVDTQNHYTIITRSVREFYEKAKFRFQDANQIIDAQVIERTGRFFKQLPFCLVLPTFLIKSTQIQNIHNSISRLNYSNYYIAEDSSVYAQSYSYLNYSALIRDKCPRKSVILMVNGQLLLNSLNYLNSLYQKYDTWVLYSQEKSILQIWSMYERVFDLISINDFSGKYSRFLNSYDANIFATMATLALIELSPYNMLQIDKTRLFSSQQRSPLHLDTGSQQIVSRPTYMRLGKLSQDFYLESDLLDSIRQGYAEIIVTGVQIISQVNRKKMMQSIQREQIPYLPLNHSIGQIQQLHYSSKFSVDKFRSVDKQVPFCVSVMSRNNMENNRYSKLVESIFQQNYENYRVIFIDDFSTDDTLKQTMRMFREKGFATNTTLPRHQGGRRAVFVRNRKQMFTTHNFLNAAFNYCDDDEVQLLIDGDDELIGKEAFSVMNSAYQLNKGLWYVYSCYKDNLYKYGRSFGTETNLVIDGARTLPTPVGAIRSFYVKLIRSIPLSYHKISNGGWLDTLSDDALSFSLIERAQMKRTKYIPQLLYEYNLFFGVHDNSTPERQAHRKRIQAQTKKRKPLSPAISLEACKQDEETANILKNEKGVIFDEIPL